MHDAAHIQPPPILLAEDDENDVLLLRRAFTVAGVRNPLVVARNGEEAIAMLKGQSPALFADPALLITDIKMPKVDGFELLLWLQTQPRFASLTRLVISSSVLEHDLARSLQLGAAAYFVKPHSHTELVDLVRLWKEKFLPAVPCV